MWGLRCCGFGRQIPTESTTVEAAGKLWHSDLRFV